MSELEYHRPYYKEEITESRKKAKEYLNHTSRRGYHTDSFLKIDGVEIF